MPAKLLYNSNNGDHFIPECARAFASMLFEEEIEILRIAEAKAVADLGDIPVAVLQQVGGFRDQFFGNDLCSGLASELFQTMIEMIHMSMQLFGKIIGCFQTDTVLGGIDRELVIEQVHEFTHQSFTFLDLLVGNEPRLELEHIVNDQLQDAADDIMTVFGMLCKLSLHQAEQVFELFVLLFVEEEKRVDAAFETLPDLPELFAQIGVQVKVVEETDITILFAGEVLPAEFDLGVIEEDGRTVDGYLSFFGDQHCIASADTELEIIPPAEWDSGHTVLSLQHIEMAGPSLRCQQVFRDLPVGAGVILYDAFALFHFPKLINSKKMGDRIMEHANGRRNEDVKVRADILKSDLGNDAVKYFHNFG